MTNVAAPPFSSSRARHSVSRSNCVKMILVRHPPGSVVLRLRPAWPNGNPSRKHHAEDSRPADAVLLGECVTRDSGLILSGHLAAMVCWLSRSRIGVRRRGAWLTGGASWLPGRGWRRAVRGEAQDHRSRADLSSPRGTRGPAVDQQSVPSIRSSSQYVTRCGLGTSRAVTC